MTFDKWWENYGNSEGDQTTMDMIAKYGIKSVRLIAENAWLASIASQPDVEADADYCSICKTVHKTGGNPDCVF